MRLVGGLLLASVFSISVNATCPTPAFSSESLPTPPMTTIGSGWNGGYIVTNVSQIPVRVKLKKTDPDGNGYVPYSVAYSDNFSASNTPLDLVNGAELLPGEMGTITIYDPATHTINVGNIRWEADACIHDALMVTYFNQYNTSYKYSSGRFHLNNGKPF